MASRSSTLERSRPCLAVRGARWLFRGARRLGWRCDLSRERVLHAALPGGEAWDDGHAGAALDQLLQSLQQDIQLHDLGRWLMWRYMIDLLRSRATAMQAWQENPEILSAAVKQPVFVVGLPRTGTTLLYNLLAVDPRARPLMVWESFLPALSTQPGGEAECRRRSQRLTRVLRYTVPELCNIHSLRGDGPEECTWLMTHTFMSPAFTMGADLPEYRKWLWSRAADALLPAYEFYRRLLQLLQWRRPGGPWLLKSPAHLFALDVLLATFPDARVIYLHRDLRQAIPSGCSLFAVTRSQFSDHVDPQLVGSAYIETAANLVRRASEVRQAHAASICDVSYNDLVREPLATVRRIYSFLGESLETDTADLMDTWLKRDAQTRRAVHRYSLPQFGLSEELLIEAFGEKTFHEEAGTMQAGR